MKPAKAPDRGVPVRAAEGNTYGFDVRATKKWSKWGFFVEFVNVTNHSNVFGYDYFRTRDSTGNVVLTRDNEGASRSCPRSA